MKKKTKYPYALSMNTILILFFCIFIVIIPTLLNGQVGIQTDNPDPSSALEVYSQDKGILVPRVTLTADLSDPAPVDAPATGLIIYNIGNDQEHGFYFWSGSVWKMLKPQKETDMHGPDSSTDNAVARFDGTDGNLLQNSIVILNDGGNMTGINNLTTAGFTMPTGAIDGNVLGSDASGNASWMDPPYPDVEDDDVLIVPAAQAIDFHGAVSVADEGNNKASVTVSENICVEQVIQVSSSRSIDLNVLEGCVAVIDWDIEHFKDDTTFSHSSFINPSRITVLKDGTYEINYMFSFDNTNQKRKTLRSRLRINGSEIIQGSTTYGFIYSMFDDKASLVSSSFLLTLDAGDYVEVVVNGQTNDGAVNLIVNENLFYVRVLRTW